MTTEEAEQIFGSVWERLQHRALQASPHEICGFVLDDGSIVEVANVAENPLNDFQMAHYDVAKRMTLEQFKRIIAIWHTHPKGATYPSPNDIHAMNVGAVHRDWFYAIVTCKTVTLWNPKDYMPQDHSFWSEFIEDGRTATAS